jgi:DNA-binding MarR family transcriptional regulator
VITPEGTALLANIETFARSAHRDTIAVLSADEQKLLISLLQRVVIAAGAA